MSKSPEHQQRKDALNISTPTETSFLTNQPASALPAPPAGYYAPAALPGTIEDPPAAYVVQQQQSHGTPQHALHMETALANPIPVYKDSTPPAKMGVPLSTPVPTAAGAFAEARSPQDLLRGMTSIYVRQKIEPWELFTDCEIENVYRVYRKRTTPGKDKPDGQMLFKCKEKSGCCTRNCLGAACRPFSMSVDCRYVLPNGNKRMEPFLRLERPYVCTCCCFFRPFVNVYHMNGKERTLLGKVTEPCALSDIAIDVARSQEEQQLYSITTACCQCGMIFQCSCKGCNEVSFGVKDSRTGRDVGKIKKVKSICVKLCVDLLRDCNKRGQLHGGVSYGG